MSRTNHSLTRRTFVQQAAAGSLALVAAPALVTAAKSDAKRPIVGVGDHQYEVDHHWAKLPAKFTWQTTHNVAVGSDGSVYVIHEGRPDQPDHPSIFVFDPEGNYIRSFGSQFQGGGHGLEVRQEGSDDFVYATAYQMKRSFAKLTPDGETVWHKFAPMEAGGYAEGENVLPRTDNPWGRDRFHPTNYAFLPDGGFYLADGYGSFRMHRYDADGKWLSSFGKPSDGDKPADGAFNTPHGVWIDARGDEPLVVVADRANKRLQWFTLDGEHRRTQDGFLLPANVDSQGELLLVPDLVGRVTLLNGKNEVVSHLGDDSERMKADANFAIRGDEKQWNAGKFVHPHDACFDADGNIYVAEWVGSGRVSKLKKLS
ncbi:NHL repeat-containing protein [Lacipirellula limnantheis]|uniref:NHL repeat protein n=1 Tax=Lacipirellula limnantheis TaxID=2528024 RepID=A0A517U378_9BACT|nr:hypothetical protein [Lacipirellula limnantheis]QDT75071.1 NHL repeat protein [Lacipirellula limnantheis]